ncbi:MAG: DUF3460 family protein [Betaproteobacteria bacterium]|nr:DUF3460 family protein [Betaproteobacteria bacterium]
MDRRYVSEFTRFMSQYLADHPEALEEQRRGWDIYWDHHVDFSAQEKAREDAVPDDTYGFHPVIRAKHLH